MADVRKNRETLEDAMIREGRANLDRFDMEAMREGGAIRHFRNNFALRRPRKPMAHCPPVAKQERSL
jgi:hypothetical protein